MTVFRNDIALRPYAEGDLGLLTRLRTDPRLRTHLGGPQAREQILERHQRYLEADDRLFVIVRGIEKLSVGWAGYWEMTFRNAAVYETGWIVLAEHQGQGVGSTAARLVVEKARERGGRRDLHAFPSVDNAASNALCSGLGFQLRGEFDDEWPPGHRVRANDWYLDLQQA